MKQSKKGRIPKGSMLAAMMSPEVSLLIPLLILVAITSYVKPSFLTVKNFQVILRFATFVAVLAIGEALVLMSGEIDLSIGANSAVAAVVFAICAITFQWPAFFAILAGLLAGALMGALNGFLCCCCGLSSWITTLSTQFLCTGLAVTLAKGEPVSTLNDAYGAFAAAKPMGISWLFFIMLGILVIMEIVVRFMPFGRNLQAVGGNKDAALMAGINVRAVKWVALILAGVMAAVCGIMTAVNAQSAAPNTGPGMEFSAIICCAIGGISMAGGSGSILGVGIGVMMLQVLKNCMQMLKVENNWQLVATGIILILAVYFDIVKKKLQEKAATKQKGGAKNV